MPTLTERLNDAHERARRIYLRRQDVEGQRQQLAQQAQALEMALIKTDGEIAVLEILIAETPSGE